MNYIMKVADGTSYSKLAVFCLDIVYYLCISCGANNKYCINRNLVCICYFMQTY